MKYNYQLINKKTYNNEGLEDTFVLLILWEECLGEVVGLLIERAR